MGKLNTDALNKVVGLEKNGQGLAEKKRKQNTKKQASDYIRLDLKPLGGKDLKAYVEKRAKEESIKQGRNISTTKYIQELIEQDMQSTENRNAALIKKIERIDSAEDLKALDYIVSKFI